MSFEKREGLLLAGVLVFDAENAVVDGSRRNQEREEREKENERREKWHDERQQEEEEDNFTVVGFHNLVYEIEKPIAILPSLYAIAKPMVVARGPSLLCTV